MRPGAGSEPSCAGCGSNGVAVGVGPSGALQHGISEQAPRPGTSGSPPDVAGRCDEALNTGGALAAMIPPPGAGEPGSGRVGLIPALARRGAARLG
jgi:hypothetical protein